MEVRDNSLMTMIYCKVRMILWLRKKKRKENKIWYNFRLLFDMLWFLTAYSLRHISYSIFLTAYFLRHISYGIFLKAYFLGYSHSFLENVLGWFTRRNQSHYVTRAQGATVRQYTCSCCSGRLMLMYSVADGHLTVSFFKSEDFRLCFKHAVGL